MPLMVFTMTFMPRDFSSDSSTIAGLCASMTTAAIRGHVDTERDDASIGTRFHGAVRP